MKNIFILSIVTILTLLLTECLHQRTDTADITIGAIYNLSGSQRNLDVPSAQGARAAVEIINRKGGLLGKRVILSIMDGESQSRIVARQTEKMIQSNPFMPGIIGLSDTDMVLAAAPVAAGFKRVFLTSGATSPQLPQQVPEYLYLACFGDNVQAAVGAEWTYTSLGARDIMILFNKNSTYARLLQNYFHTRFAELGGRVVKSVSYAPVDLSSLPIESGKIDLVYLSVTPDEVLAAIGRLRKAGISAPVLGGDGLDIGAAWQQGKELEDIFFTTHAYIGSENANPRIKAFRKSFAEMFPKTEPDAFTALGFDSVNLLAAAIEKTGSIDPEAVRNALANMKEYQGVTGLISYPSGSQVPVKSVTIINVSRGKQKAIGEYLPAKTPNP